MLSNLDPNQRALADYMSELSEQAWSAGWESGLEYSLWDVLMNGPTLYGRLDLTAVHVDHLRRLSERCGGWIVFDDAQEETWVSLPEWRSLYAERETGPLTG